jgi:N-ethylmaleimide reductase
MTTLFNPLTVGDLTLPNRILMAPLTRMRSKQPGNIPYKLNAEYYAQRAGAGLIISEATQVSQQGQGYPATPGIHSPEQVEGWKTVTDAVHQKGGRIFVQLWHVGRISHSSHQIAGNLPVAPSAIKPTGEVLTANWEQLPYETPHALEMSEIEAIVADYTKAAENSKIAGFDGVEVHGANGYLLDQFLQDGTNQRIDRYGGSIENRARFLLEVVDAIIKVWGNGRVGVRLSPYGTFNDMSDSDPQALFAYVLTELSARKIAYTHVIEPRAGGGGDEVADAPSTSQLFRSAFKGVFISAGGYNAENAKQAIESGDVDAVAFGRLFISNPDLSERIKTGAPLTKYNRETFYGGSEKGYTDYASIN